MNTLTDEGIRDVLDQYGLTYIFSERISKVCKVYTNLGNFALKQVDRGEQLTFFQLHHHLYEKGYRRVVPIIPTLDGRQAVRYEENFYYLMPWFDGSSRTDYGESYQYLTRELARLHSITVQVVQVTEEELEQHYQSVFAKFDREKDLLDQYMELTEDAVYMSPFQLYICMIFHEVEGAGQFAINQLNAWFEEVKKEKKLRSVVNHGKVSPDHFLYNVEGAGFFSSIEQLTIASPIYDVITFIKHHINAHRNHFTQVLKHLEEYLQYFPLSITETSLLLSYLAFPRTIFQTIENYYMDRGSNNEYDSVKQLMIAYNEMKNMEQVIIYFESKKQPLDEE